MDFIDTNSTVTKVAFIILMLIVFMLMFKLGVAFVSYLMSPSTSPYIVQGMVAGNINLVIPQNPKETDAVTLYRSDNQTTGIESTWSVWVYVNGRDTQTNSGANYGHIFHKGDASLGTNNYSTMNNSPGLYIKNPITSAAYNNSVTFVVKMSTFDKTNPELSLELDNMPVKKWVHVAIRIQNTILDVYINGTIARRQIFQQTLPKQNYGSVYVGTGGGFNGYISNLRYYAYSLNVFQINSIVSAGPDLTAGKGLTPATNKYYLGNTWYFSHYN